MSGLIWYVAGILSTAAALLLWGIVAAYLIRHEVGVTHMTTAQDQERDILEIWRRQMHGEFDKKEPRP